jgi:hypothetical protein
VFFTSCLNSGQGGKNGKFMLITLLILTETSEEEKELARRILGEMTPVFK